METIISSLIDFIMILGIVCVFCLPIMVIIYLFEKYANKHPKIYEFINKFWED